MQQRTQLARDTRAIDTALPPQVARRKTRAYLKLYQSICSGHGQGHGAAYKAWLQLRRKNSSPESNQIVSWMPLLNRIAHYFSRGEYQTALLLLWLNVSDLREQYPIWPISHPHPLQGAPGSDGLAFRFARGLLSIAQEAGIDHGVLRRYPGIRHPARQILVIAYFFDSSEEFLLAYCAAKTKLAEGEASVFGVPLSVSWREELRRQVEDEKKSVSEASRTLGIPLPQAIRYANRDQIQYDKRPRVLTPALETQLRIMIRQGAERSEITAQTGIKASYLRAYLAKHLVLRDEWQNNRSEAIRDQRRKDFMAFLAAHRGVPVHLLRKTSGSGYAWLFRHDRAWLEGLPVFERSGSFDSRTYETERSIAKRKNRG